MMEVHKTYMAELEIEVLREKNKKLKQEINQLKDLLDKHLNIKSTAFLTLCLRNLLRLMIWAFPSRSLPIRKGSVS